MFVSAIVLAGGKGRRFGTRIPKPFVALGGKPVVEHCLRDLRKVKEIRQVIMAVSPSVRKAAAAAMRRSAWEGCPVVLGGARRQDSVRNCLKELDPRAELVIVHDGVRPFAGAAMVRAVIRAAAASGAAICAVPAKATIKRVAGGRVKATLEREELWEAQTPQCFRRELLVKAYRSAGRRAVTDDASLIEKLGRPVTVVNGDYTNIKITTPEDLVIAEALLKRRKVR